MNVYLIISKDHTQSYVTAKLSDAQNKEKELSGIVYEWVSLWGRPYNVNLDEYDNTSLPWRMLKLAYEQGNWNINAKYKVDYFDNRIFILENGIKVKKDED